MLLSPNVCLPSSTCWQQQNALQSVQECLRTSMCVPGWGPGYLPLPLPLHSEVGRRHRVLTHLKASRW